MSGWFVRNAQAMAKVPFVRDVMTLQLGGFFGMGLGFAKSILFARLLGLEGFGQYAVILAFSGTVGAFTNFGQNQAALTFFAEAFVRKDRDEMLWVLRYYLQLSAIAAGVLLLLAVSSPWLTGWLYDAPSLGLAAALAFLGTIIGSMHSLFLVLLQSAREIKRMTALESTNTFLQLALSAGLLIAGYGVTGIFAGIFLSNAIMLVAYAHAYGRIRRQHALLPAVSEFWTPGPSTAPLVKQGLWIAMDKSLGNLFPQGFLFVMSMLTSPTQVGLARLSFSLASLPGSFLLPHLNRMAMSILPSVREQGVDALRRSVARLIKHALAIHTALSVIGMIALPYAALAMYGVEFSGMITPMLWLIVVLLVSALNIANSPLLRLYKKAHVPALWNAVALPIQFLILALLMRVMAPLDAFVAIIAINLGSALWISVYVYGVLLRKR